MKCKLTPQTIDLIFVSQLYAVPKVLENLRLFIDLFYSYIYSQQNSSKIQNEIYLLNDLLDAKDIQNLKSIPSVNTILKANKEISLFIGNEMIKGQKWIFDYMDVIEGFNNYSNSVNRIIELNINIFSSCIGLKFNIPETYDSYRKDVYKEVSKSMIEIFEKIENSDKQLTYTEILKYLDELFDKSDKLKEIKHNCLIQSKFQQDKLFTKDLARQVIAGTISGGIILSLQYYFLQH